MPSITFQELMKRREKAASNVSRWERRISLDFTKLKGARKRLAYYDKAVEKAYKAMSTGGTKRVVDL